MSENSPLPTVGKGTPITSAKQKHAYQLTQNPNWLAQASERVERTIEMINAKKVDEALRDLCELDVVFENSGICVCETDSTQDTSPLPGLGGQSIEARFLRNKSAI
jgi:hypothetical protein